MQLGMREEGDRRLASVYKPEKRGKLVVRPFGPAMQPGLLQSWALPSATGDIICP